jgi:hypothetical protein
MRISLPAGRTIAFSLTLAALAACVPSQAARTGIKLDDPAQIRALFDSLEAVRLERQVVASQREGGPRLELSTEAMYTSRVEARFRLEDDAYVAAFNVGPDGRIAMVYPEAPEDPTLLRAGHTYRLPEFFPGFEPHRVGYAQTGYSATGVGARASGSGGYVFVVASWSPLRIDRLEELGLTDAYRNVNLGGSLQPYEVMHEYAETLVPRGKRWYTVKYRYYGEPGGSLVASRACARYGPLASLGIGYGFIESLLHNRLYSPFVVRSLLSDLAFDGCDAGSAYRAYALALAMGYGRVNPGPALPPIPKPPVANPGNNGGAPTSGAGSQPAPPEQQPRDRGGRPRVGDCDDDKSDDCGLPTRQPRRGNAAGGNDDAIELGGRRGGAASEDRRGVRSWGASGRDLPVTDGPRSYRGRAGRADDASSAGPVPSPRVNRPRSEPVREAPPPRIERSEPPPRVERSEPPPRVERSEPPAPRVERTEAPRPKPVEPPVQP